MATDLLPKDLVCQCLEEARPSVDIRGRPEYKRMLVGWGYEHDITPHTLSADRDRLRALIDTLDSWLLTVDEAHRTTAAYPNMNGAREALRRLRAFEGLIDAVKPNNNGPWSPHGTAECLRLAELHPTLFWPKFWEWVGYAELDDPLYQTQTLEPDMHFFLAILGPGLVELMAAHPDVQRRCCREALTHALARRVIWEENISTQYFMEAMRLTGLAGHFVPPRMPGRRRYYRSVHGSDHLWIDE
jgi:hypothetical protein